ncbi:GFA family protein [Shinella sumterensis]|uniref:GFA family protein n=1 Tax=Shinella sumterensis TaxID=1967501 RepID=UPI003F8743A5
MERHTGGCRCGAIRFEANSKPFYGAYCHCSDCRRASGAPVAAFVGFLSADVTFVDFEGSTYGQHPIQRSFCPTCGAPIAYRDARISEQVFFMIGAMDHPEQYPPTMHGYAGSQLPFVHIADGLPRKKSNTALRPGES